MVLTICTMKMTWLILALLTVVIAAGLSWQHQSFVALRHEADGLRAAHHGKERAAPNHLRPAAPEVVPADLAQIQADLAIIVQLRGELEAIKHRVAAAGRGPVTDKAVPGTNPPPSLLDGPVNAADWRNVGRSTPAAVFETALWAAAGGDTDMLAEALALDAGAQARAAGLLASLPPELRAQFSTPEKFVAFMTVRDVPEGAARILRQVSGPTGTKLVARLMDAEGKARTVVFSLRSDNDKWRLVVPEAVIDRYATFLRGQKP
jgi:hypothetical protein